MTAKPTYYALLVILLYALCPGNTFNNFTITSGECRFIDVTECLNCPKTGSLVTTVIVGINFSCKYLNSIISANSVIEWDNGQSSNISWNAIIVKVNAIKVTELIGNVTSGPFKDSKITITFIHPDITLNCTQPNGVTEVHVTGIGTIGLNLFYNNGSAHYSPGNDFTLKPTNITYTYYITFFLLLPLNC